MNRHKRCSTDPKPIHKIGSQIRLVPREGTVIATANTLGKKGELTCMYVVRFGKEVKYLYAEEIEKQ